MCGLATRCVNVCVTCMLMCGWSACSVAHSALLLNHSLAVGTRCTPDLTIIGALCAVFFDLVELVVPSELHKDLWFRLMDVQGSANTETGQVSHIDFEEFQKLNMIYQAPMFHKGLTPSWETTRCVWSTPHVYVGPTSNPHQSSQRVLPCFPDTSLRFKSEFVFIVLPQVQISI